MKKVAIVINDISRAQEHEWFIDYINKEKFQVTFILINSKDTVMDYFLSENNVPVEHLKYNSKKNLPGLIWKLFVLFKKHKFDIVHTHLFDASISGLTAACLAGIPMRIMTRHYSDYHHRYFPSAVKYDRYMNRVATHIVAISKNVEDILLNREHVKPGKVFLIHHGLHIPDYLSENIDEYRINSIRKKYDLEGVWPVVGAISRFTELKGLQFLIPAFKKLLMEYEGAILFMANASGDYENEIDQLLSDIPEKNIRRVQFENDIVALYRMFDCFVHIPVSPTVEAFGQTYIEALASKVPSVFTLSGVAPEFIEDRKNAFVVDFCNSDQVFDAIYYIVTHKNSMPEMLEKGFNDVENKFNFGLKMSKLENLYLNSI